MDSQQSVDEFLLYLKVEQNYSTVTINSYELDLARFHQFLKQHHRSCELQDFNRSIVRRFILDQMMNANMKPRTIQRRISGLNSFCKYVLKERLIDTDFMVDIKPPKSDFMLPVSSLFSSLYKNARLVKKLICLRFKVLSVIFSICFIVSLENLLPFPCNDLANPLLASLIDIHILPIITKISKVGESSCKFPINSPSSVPI